MIDFKINNRYISKLSSTKQSIIALFTGRLSITIIGIVISFIQARFLTPEDLGYFKQFGILTSYLLFLHLGSFHALERLYPYYIGKNNKEMAIGIVEVAHSWILIVFVPTSLLFIVFSVLSFSKGNWKAGLGWLAQSFVLFSMLYGGFIRAIYRSGQDFKNMAWFEIIGSFLSFLVVPFFWIQPYFALFLRNTTEFYSVVLLIKNRPIKFKLRFSWKELFFLMNQGLPRFSSAYMITTGLEAITATIILKQLGIRQLGLWSFTWMIFLISAQLPQAIVAVFVPKIIENYGKSNSVAHCLLTCKKPILYGFVVLIVVISFGLFGVKILLPRVLPNYTEAANLICLLLLVLPLMLIEVPATILNAMNWMKWINIVAFVTMSTQVLVILLFLGFGWGLYSVAIGIFMGKTTRVILLWMLLNKAYRFELDNMQGC